MEFKIGDKVRVRKDLVAGKMYGMVGFMDSMEKFKGKIVTIEGVFNKEYSIEESGKMWTDEMFEHNTKEDFKDIKIHVRNPIESEAVQRRLFELGKGWYEGDYCYAKKLKHLHSRYLFTNDVGIEYSDLFDIFNKCHCREVTVEELLGTATKESLTPNADNGNCMSKGYIMEETMKIKEHETKPEIKKPKVISPEKYDYLYDIEEDGLRIVELDRKYFLIDKQDNKVSKEYDGIYSLEEDGLRKAKLNGKWILINSKGEKVSKGYDYIYDLEAEGLRIAELNENYFLIDKQGKEVSKEYDWIGNIEADGRRIARLNWKWFLINSKDEKVSKEYDWIYELEADGRRIAKLNGKWILINSKEENGLRRAKLNGKEFLIDKQDNKVSKDHDNIFDFEKEGLRIAELNEKYFLIDKQDKKVSKEYDYIDNLEADGLRRARLNGKWFLIDKQDKKVSKEYGDIYNLEADGLRRAIDMNGKWILINSKDEKVSKEYDFILDIESDGLRTATLNGKLFLINSKDEKVSKEDDYIFNLETDGLRKAKLNGKGVWLEVIDDDVTTKELQDGLDRLYDTLYSKFPTARDLVAEIVETEIELEELKEESTKCNQIKNCDTCGKQILIFEYESNKGLCNNCVANIN